MKQHFKHIYFCVIHYHVHPFKCLNVTHLTICVIKSQTRHSIPAWWCCYPLNQIIVFVRMYIPIEVQWLLVLCWLFLCDGVNAMLYMYIPKVVLLLCSPPRNSIRINSPNHKLESPCEYTNISNLRLSHKTNTIIVCKGYLSRDIQVKQFLRDAIRYLDTNPSTKPDIKPMLVVARLIGSQLQTYTKLCCEECNNKTHVHENTQSQPYSHKRGKSITANVCLGFWGVK